MSTIAILVLLVVAVLAFKLRRPKPRPFQYERYPAPSAEVLALIEQRRKLDAVKLYRAQNGVGLLEAKRVVDHHARMRGAG